MDGRMDGRTYGRTEVARYDTYADNQITVLLFSTVLPSKHENMIKKSSVSKGDMRS